MDANTIIKSIESVTGKWKKQRKREERGRAQSRQAVFTRKYRMSIKDAAASVMREAYLKVSGDGRYPVSARQLYYACRTRILELTERDSLDGNYFSQTIIPEYLAAAHRSEYLAAHRSETADWDVTYDARGGIAEPHTGLVTPLGTLNVRQYLADIETHAVPDIGEACFKDAAYPTKGPEHRFSAIMYIEKEGFLPLFKSAELAQRYDIAIMSTKGMPVVACRHLADELCGRHRIPLLVLHDFDKSGFSILGTLSDATHFGNGYDHMPRYEYRHAFEVIDLGLRLADVREYQLEAEPVVYKSDPTDNLKENGATKDEIKFLYEGWRGQRVELNAFTSGEFIEWIESKLKQHGVKKVVPDADTLKVAYRRALQLSIIRLRMKDIAKEAHKEADEAKIPAKLEQTIRKRLVENPALPWDRVIADLAAEL